MQASQLNKVEDKKMKIIKTFGFFSIVFAGVLFFGILNSVKAQSGSMEWRGTVDDRIQVVIRGRSATVNTLSGSSYNDDRANFNGGGGRWANGRRYRASVSKQNGRGKVRIVQQPNQRNNYTTIVEVDDSKGGADRYRFNVTWN